VVTADQGVEDQPVNCCHDRRRRAGANVLGGQRDEAVAGGNEWRAEGRVASGHQEQLVASQRQGAAGAEPVLYLAGLVGETRRGRGYLELLHRAGEVAAPRTAAELQAGLGQPADLRTIGCMVFATLAI